MREYYRRYAASIEEDKRALAALEIEAKSLGLNLDEQSSISTLLTQLDRKRDHLDTLTKQETGWTFSFYLTTLKISDPEEAIAQLARDREELRLLEKQVDVLRRLRRLRPEPA